MAQVLDLPAANRRPADVPAPTAATSRFILVDADELRRLAELAGDHLSFLLDDAGRKETLRSAHGLAKGLAELERAASGERP